MQIQRAKDASPTREYNCDLRRLMPWATVADGTPWGAAIATVHPGDATDPHEHDEDEVFFVLSGLGTLSIGDETQVLERGDFVRIPRSVRHTMANHGDEALEFMSVYWGEKPRYFASPAAAE